MNDAQRNAKKLGDFWYEFLMAEFKNETDRGAVLLTTSLLDNALTSLLKKRFVPISSTEDELLDGPQAPIGSLSSKIQMAQRLGLISSRLARDMNLIRKMRNEFAHNIHSSGFDSGKIKELLTNLTSSSTIIGSYGSFDSSYPDGSRRDFLKVATIAIFHLHQVIENPQHAPPLKAAEEEWIYTWKFVEPVASATPVPAVVPKKQD